MLRLIVVVQRLGIVVVGSGPEEGGIHVQVFALVDGRGHVDAGHVVSEHGTKAPVRQDAGQTQVLQTHADLHFRFRNEPVQIGKAQLDNLAVRAKCTAQDYGRKSENAPSKLLPSMQKGIRKDLPCARQQLHVVRKYFFSLP